MAKPTDEKFLRDIVMDLNTMQAANAQLHRNLTEQKNSNQQLIIMLSAVLKHHHEGRADVPLSVVMALPETGVLKHWNSDVEMTMCLQYSEPDGPAAEVTDRPNIATLDNTPRPKLVIAHD